MAQQTIPFTKEKATLSVEEQDRRGLLRGLKFGLPIGIALWAGIIGGLYYLFG